MTDREKLVYLIKENAKAIVSSTENGVCVCLDVETLADSLIAHGVYVRESQKPCKFEEISLCEYYWIEYKHEIFTSMEIACAFCKTSEYCMIDLVGLCSSHPHRKELYNKTWRCWAEKPTEEERKAAEWL